MIPTCDWHGPRRAWTTASRPREWTVLAAALVAAALVALAGPARAQDDLPGRVGRVADVGGALSIAPADRPEQWEPAAINHTVIGGDNLWVSAEGRAEIDYGGGQFRIAGDSSVHISRLDDRTMSLFVAQGAVVLRVRVLDPGDAVGVDTPNAQVQIARAGLYRIDVAPDRTRSMLTVREGEAVMHLPGGSDRVMPGQTAEAVGRDAQRADVRTGGVSDGFDAWSASRDRRYERSRTASYVSRQMIGYSDLDEHGSWEQYPEYGAVWFPGGVAADWAPYRYGRWSWVGGYGWTWVDDAPWGYAPFHYGRWAFVGGRWGWCPGGYVARPVWAPALVAWYGGPGWSFSVSAGAPAYGWVPLGWGEPYLPWWSNCSHRCWTMYNRPYAVRYAERPASPPSRYVNQAHPGGFTVVSRDVLVRRERVSRATLAVPPQAATGAPVLATSPEVRPAPARIPGSRTGPAEAPPPASSFYPTGRPSRIVPADAQPGAAAPARSQTPPPAAAPAGPSRPSRSVQPVPDAAPAPAPRAVPSEVPRSRAAPATAYPAPTPSTRGPAQPLPPPTMRAPAPRVESPPAQAQPSPRTRVSPPPSPQPAQAAQPAPAPQSRAPAPVPQPQQAPAPSRAPSSRSPPQPPAEAPANPR